MITTTHVVVNAVLARRVQERPTSLSTPGARRLFVLGGLAPDVALYLLTLGAAVYYPLVQDMSMRDTARLAFDDLYFNDPLWVAGHNLLHAPLVLLALYVLGSRLAGARGLRLRAFALGCALHAVVDIAVHHDDGPLLLFPVEWTIRFASPVSYYDSDHYGNWVEPVDLGITVVGGAFLLLILIRDRRTRRRRERHPG